MLVLDAMAVIHLAKVSVLETIVKSFGGAVIPKAVEEEAITTGRRLGKPDAELIAMFVERKIITVKEVSWSALCENLYNLGLGGGELEAMALCNENKGWLLVSNDKAARNAAQVFGINSISVPQLIVAAALEKKLEKGKGIEAIKSLKKVGWYSETVVEDSIKILESEEK